MEREYYLEYGWFLAEPDQIEVDRLSREVGVSGLVARILANRGVLDTNEAGKFMSPSLDHLHDPLVLPDMEKGARRIVAAIRSKEKILIHGDYDIDGVTSTALLVRTLERLDANVDYKVPHRRKDGYDIKPAAVEHAHQQGTKVIVTCDCGTTALSSADTAHKLGVDLIVTDHHEPGPVLPKAYALINPKRKDTSYPFPELAGVGVALKTAQAIAGFMDINPATVLKAYLDLAALGTVGDVAPLLGENRAIVRHGLVSMSNSKKTGMQAAIKSTGYSGKVLSPYFIGFVLGPRLNAVGRLEDAATSVRLLLTTDENEAGGIMSRLEEMNNERRVVQDTIMREAMELISAKNMDSMRVLILSKAGWNSGVVGIVAGRLCEQFGMPTILLSEDPRTGHCHGSGRSVPGFHMKEALEMCADLLLRSGGHAGAVGLALLREHLDEFEDRLNKIALEIIPEEEVGPRIDVDAELDVSSVSMEIAAVIQSMEPFGCGNPEPVFVSSGLLVSHTQTMGADGGHLKLFFEGDDAKPLECIAFKWGQHRNLFPPGAVVDVCYNLRINEFNGNRNTQMVAIDIRKTS
jgi:single-stranded-DNA-specific exonuclease